jgi:hypothetical protein
MKTKSSRHHGRGVELFLAQHGADVTGVIAGFDRLPLRASLRDLYPPSFLFRHLCNAGVLLKNFGAYTLVLVGKINRGAPPPFCHPATGPPVALCGRIDQNIYSPASAPRSLSSDFVPHGFAGVARPRSIRLRPADLERRHAPNSIVLPPRQGYSGGAPRVKIPSAVGP